MFFTDETIGSGILAVIVIAAILILIVIYLFTKKPVRTSTPLLPTDEDNGQKEKQAVTTELEKLKLAGFVVDDDGDYFDLRDVLQLSQDRTSVIVETRNYRYTITGQAQIERLVDALCELRQPKRTQLPAGKATP